MKATPLETVDSLAARMGVPRRTIVREVMRCRLPYVSIAGHWRFRARDVEVWLERAGSLPRMQLVQGGASWPAGREGERDGWVADREDATPANGRRPTG